MITEDKNKPVFDNNEDDKIIKHSQKANSHYQEKSLYKNSHNIIILLIFLTILNLFIFFFSKNKTK